MLEFQGANEKDESAISLKKKSPEQDRENKKFAIVWPV
jgi:hypothetical protein